MAQTYGITDIEKVRPTSLLTFLYGLDADSRTKRAICGNRISTQMALLAGSYDMLRTLVWFKTKDGHRNRNRPQSVLQQLISGKKPDNEMELYESGEEFEKARAKLIKR